MSAVFRNAVKNQFPPRTLMLIIVASPCMLAIITAPARAEPLSDVRGILAPASEAVFTTDLNAPVSKIGFKEGETFKSGEVLIAFDCRRQRAELASLKAQHREMEFALKGNQFLHRRGAAGKIELEVSRARADRAAQDAKALEVRLERCVIAAPFDGKVRGLGINEHETPVANRPILEIITADKVELQLIVPSLWLSWLTIDTTFAFTVDETARTYDARVIRIGAAVDPVSQTITVIGAMTSGTSGVRAGMSGAATFKVHGG